VGIAHHGQAAANRSRAEVETLVDRAHPTFSGILRLNLPRVPMGSFRAEWIPAPVSETRPTADARLGANSRGSPRFGRVTTPSRLKIEANRPTTRTERTRRGVKKTQIAITPSAHTVGEFVGSVRDRVLSPPSRPMLPNRRPVGRALEFVTSITVDTGGEFPPTADGPEPGQNGDPWKGRIAASDDRAEFATSVTVGSTPIWTVP
jgi:hypothetical protein